MNKFILFFILFNLIISTKVEEEEEDDFNADSYDQMNDVAEFQDGLRDYLIKNNLWESDRIIEREEMNKIFIEIILEKGMEGVPEGLRGIVEECRRYFVTKYYKKKKVIRGKDIFGLIDILMIYRKFEQLTGNPDYDVDYDMFEDEDDIVEAHENNIIEKEMDSAL